MDLKFMKISLFVSFIFGAFALVFGDEVIGRGKPGDNAIRLFAGLGREINLICDIGVDFSSRNESSKPYWSFTALSGKSDDNLGDNCMLNNKAKSKSKKKSDDKVSQNQTVPFTDCSIIDKDSPLFKLELDDVTEDEFGDFVCHSGDGKSVTFQLREMVTLIRKSEKGKHVKSLTIVEGEELYLSCSETGLKDLHKVSWCKDGKNITNDLIAGTGLFENFTRVDNLHYEGVAHLNHRGFYVCRVDLKNNTQVNCTDNKRNAGDPLPAEWETFIRVTGANSWKTPFYILLGEAGIIGLFTIIINQRERKLEKLEEADGQYEDSDDEDEVQKTPERSDGNGVNGNKI